MGLAALVTAALVALALGGPAPKTPDHITSLFDGPKSKDMPTILGGHWDAAKKAPVNALVIFHLEHCGFCNIEMGTIEYSYAHHQIMNKTGVAPFHVQVESEGPPDPGSAFCAQNPACVKAANEYLRVNVTALTSFPTTYFYDGDGVGRDASDTPCGIAVRGASTFDCSFDTPEAIKACAGGEEDLSNWLCNLKTGTAAPAPPPPSASCAVPGTAWERCA